MKSRYLFLIVALFTGSTSCKKELDLQPAQAIGSEVALSTDAGVKQVLTGAYDQFSGSGGYAGYYDGLFIPELFAGQNELTYTGTDPSLTEILNQQINKTNIAVAGDWSNRYKLINTCNNVLNSLVVVNAADRGRVEGEAKFLRAITLFELTKFFGQQYETGSANVQPGVPVILKPALRATDNASVRRNTVGECYEQVLSDLTDAKNLLPEVNSVYATRYAASAMLARVYLQQGDYSHALAESDRVISSGAYQLVAGYADVFGQDYNTTEDIFSIQISEQDGYNLMNVEFAAPDYGGYTMVQVTDAFITSYDSVDQRKSLYYRYGGKWLTGKFNNRFGNLTVIRLAEMYLTRAECNMRLGSSLGASPLDDYNMTRTRAGLEAASNITLGDILTERHFELAHEGFLINDLKRQHLDIGSLAYNDPKVIFPIPQSEMTVNPNLVQNPGY